MNVHDIMEELIREKGYKTRIQVCDGFDYSRIVGIRIFHKNDPQNGRQNHNKISILWTDMKVTLKYIRNTFMRHKLTVDLHDPESIPKINGFLDGFEIWPKGISTCDEYIRNGPIRKE